MRTARPLRALVALVVLLVAFSGTAHAQYFRYGKNKVQYRAQTWSFLQSRHFDVYYHEGGRELGEFTAHAAEEAYAQIADLFGHEISRRIPIIVYQSHNDFSVSNAVNLPVYAEGIGGVTELFKNRIALPFTGDYSDYRRVVHHELVHAVINDMFYGGSIQSILQNNIQLRIPLWFNEGLAEYAALGWDTKSDLYVREAVLEDHLAPIPQLGGYFAYRGGQGVWDYVAEQYGREKIGEILQRLRGTRSVDEAFRRATGLDLEGLSERWHQALKEIYFPEIAAREDLGEIARAVVTREDGYYNTSPALSPRGDRLAYISTRSGLFDVFVVSTSEGAVPRKLVEGQTNPTFESLRVLSPGLAWSPDGRRLAMAVKSGPSDVVAVVDARTGESTRYRVPGIDQIVSLSWSPDGRRIAFEGSQDAQSDIYVLDLETHETTNHTDDVFSDHEPSWRADGQALVFHSDRGPHTTPGAARAGAFDLSTHDYDQDGLYLLDLRDAGIERLTDAAGWDDTSARFGADPDRVLFISDRNGVPNLYELRVSTRAVRPLTDLTVGVLQLALSADGRRAAVVSLDEGTPSIYLLHDPFERALASDTLAPTVWAQRVEQRTARPAPALALARPERLQANPLLRDAVGGVPYRRGVARLRAWRSRPAAFADPGPALAEADGPATDVEPATTVPGAEPDSLRRQGVRVDFRNYVFADAPPPRREADAGDDAGPDDDLLEPFADDGLDEDGRYRARRYKLRFSPDIVHGQAGFDALYGVQGLTQMVFSDMLGDHRIVVATNLLIDLRNSDYLVSYEYLPRRTDYAFTALHIARLLPDFERDRFYRYRRYGVGVSMSYPFDKFSRVDGDLLLVGISQADVTDASREPVTQAMLQPGITFTHDVTRPGYLYPTGGSRVAFSLTGTPFSFSRDQVHYITALADARMYRSLHDGFYTFAFRFSGGTSWGNRQSLFYTSGVQNWVNHRFDDANGFPIKQAEDIVLGLPVYPLRGYDINARNGAHFALVNAEFRAPLVAAVLPGPIPLLPLYNLQVAAFADAGALWGRGTTGGLSLTRTDSTGARVLDDLLVGAGFGLRTLVLGYPVRLDYVWPFDGRTFGDRRLYLSLGLDF